MGIKNYWNTLQFIIRHPLSKGRVLDSLRRYVKWQIGSRLVPGPVATRFVNDSMLLAKPGMTGATGNVYLGLHEFEDMAFVLHFLRLDDLFVDIGANIGSYTILAGAGAGAKCISFEPSPEAFMWLQHNVSVNGLEKQVDIRQGAVGSNDGEVSFTIDLDCCNHLVLDKQHEDGKTLTVPVSTLDNAVKNRSPSMIKIDVEGFETEVIQGASTVLNSPELRCLIMELGGHGSQYGFDEQEIRDKLKSLDFGEYTYAPFERTLVERTNDATSANTLFVRDVSYVEQRLKEAEPFSVVNTNV